MPEPLQQLLRQVICRGNAQHATSGVFVAEEDVLGDGQALDDVKLLVHRGNAEVERRNWVGDRDLFTAPQDLA